MVFLAWLEVTLDEMEISFQALCWIFYAVGIANSAISKDVPPYVVAYRLNRFGGLNAIGLRRAGFDQEKRSEIRRVVERLFSSGKPLGEAIDEVSARSWGDHAKKVVEFASGNSHKGVLLATRR